MNKNRYFTKDEAARMEILLENEGDILSKFYDQVYDTAVKDVKIHKRRKTYSIIKTGLTSYAIYRIGKGLREVYKDTFK